MNKYALLTLFAVASASAQTTEVGKQELAAKFVIAPSLETEYVSQERTAHEYPLFEAELHPRPLIRVGRVGLVDAPVSFWDDRLVSLRRVNRLVPAGFDRSRFEGVVTWQSRSGAIRLALGITQSKTHFDIATKQKYHVSNRTTYDPTFSFQYTFPVHPAR